jgi:hypothetical protein
MIYDKNEIRKFFDNVLVPINEDEAYFMCLAARKKYLPEDSPIQLHRNHCMFGRQIVNRYDFNIYYSMLSKYETPESAYLDVNGVPLPESCKVVFANPNPSSVASAIYSLKTALAAIELEVITSRKENFWKKYKSINSELMNGYQNSVSRKNWVDIDIDVVDKSIFDIEMLRDCIVSMGVSSSNFYVIDTRGGAHVLLRNTGFSKELNPQSIVSLLSEELSHVSTEIKLCKSGLVPLPGTLQGNYPVKIW